MTASFHIGTRGSALARWQAQWVKRALMRAFPDERFTEVVIRTHGDIDRKRSLAQLGGVGVFTRELDMALLEGKIDLAVHSAKDYPTQFPKGLVVAGYPCREIPNDSLIGRRGKRLCDLREGATIGTESLRRSAQLLRLRSDLRFAGIRGNIDTRLRKIAEGRYDAIVMAEAALRRLERDDVAREMLAINRMVPAVGQGALMIVCRRDDRRMRRMVAQIGNARIKACVEAERAVLSGLGGGCRLPLGAHARVRGDHLRLRAVVVSPDASRKIETVVDVAQNEAVEAARRAVRFLVRDGARAILDGINETPPH